MKFGLYGLHRGPGIRPETLTQRSIAAEEAGFESLWVGDHITLPADLPGSEEPRLEALSALTYLAGATSKVRLAAGVLVIPQRHPVLLAKQLSSIDLLSNGRLIVGVGVGHLQAELAAFGVPMSERGSRTDDGLERLIEIWGTSVGPGHEPVGTGVVQSPAPVQLPHPPIVVGGHSPRALERAARVGNGWFGWLTNVNQTKDLVAKLMAERHRWGRTSEPLEITVAAPGQVDLDLVDEYGRIGVDRLVVGPDNTEGSEPDRFIETFESEVLSRRLP